MICRRNMERDAVIMFVMMSVAGVVLYFSGAFAPRITVLDVSTGKVEGVAAVPPLTEEEVAMEVQAINAPITTSTWKRYVNPYYGFELKYPGDWPMPGSSVAPKSSKWEYRYQFRNPRAGDTYAGFDVVIYDVLKVKELSGTEEFPKPKEGVSVADSECANIRGHAIDTGDYPASEIYIPPGNDCYQSSLFFSLIRERYIYNIVPILAVGSVADDDPRISVNAHFPEFYPVAGSVQLIDIVRPELPKAETPKPIQPKPAPPKITAPHPVSYKKDGDRLVCAKKNDHPSKSKKNKKKHLDMECCLDPDEYPNPWCYYSKDKYGKYL